MSQAQAPSWAFRNGKPATPEQVSEGWSCKKRTGEVVPFDTEKIRTALAKCFGTLLVAGVLNDSHPCYHHGARHKIAKAVVNTLAFYGVTCPGVEDIQRLVIQQLWAEGWFEAAEHYQNYREERRKERETWALDPEQIRVVHEDAAHFPTPIQYLQFLDKYARWNDVRGRRETWRECCGRVMAFFRKQPQLAAVTESEWDQLADGMYRHRVSPAMRVVQMAGPALDRCGSGGFNCCYTACDDLAVFSETLYLLMQGCGVGFSVERDYVDQLPRIKKQKDLPPQPLKIEDSTEGWCGAYRDGINAWMNGLDVEYDYSGIRPEGTRLKTKGGRASGPEPLRRLLTFTRDLFLRRQGGWLRPLDCHNILCMTGKIVQVGGVRRSSEISISDLDDTEMRDAKRGNWWETAPWLDMANNSATYMEKPDAVTFMTEWLALAKSGCGERGIFNRGGTRKQIPKRRKWTRFGLNPCGEVILRSAQMCNLSIVVARPDDTEETLTEKVRLATFFGTFQSTLTNFSPFLRPIWKQNCDEERLLGVDITGQMDCPILRPNAPGREGLLNRLRTVVLNVNTELAGRLGIPVSAAMTVVKPSGNSSMFFNCSSGMHTRWGRYQVRRFRLGRYNPIAKLLKTEGVPCQVDPLNEALLVFDFLPDPAPEGTPTRNDMTAVEQFHNWLVWKLHWTEHNPSCTLYVDPDEWLELGHEVFKHFDQIGGLTFLPKDSGTYQLAPNEELTQEEYERRRAVFPVINWAKLARYESDDTTNPLATSACEGGACEVTQCSRL